MFSFISVKKSVKCRQRLWGDWMNVHLMSWDVVAMLVATYPELKSFQYWRRAKASCMSALWAKCFIAAASEGSVWKLAILSCSCSIHTHVSRHLRVSHQGACNSAVSLGFRFPHPLWAGWSLKSVIAELPSSLFIDGNLYVGTHLCGPSGCGGFHQVLNPTRHQIRLHL